MKEPRSDSGRVEHLWILAIAVAALAGSVVLKPSHQGGLCVEIPFFGTGITMPETCASRLFLGLSCPGCGLTRSFVATARGDITAALFFNPVGPALFLACLLQIPYRIVEYGGWAERNPGWMRLKSGFDLITWAIVLGLIANWVFRFIAAAL